MDLSEKMKHLRKVEGDLRGLNRPMTQIEVVKAMQDEQDETISQAYLSQLESGKRVHLTASTRDLLARFFKVHPGYLVSDPPDFSSDLLTEMSASTEDRLAAWITAMAEEWHAEPTVATFFMRLGLVDNPRHYLSLFTDLMQLSEPELAAVAEALTQSDTH